MRLVLLVALTGCLVWQVIRLSRGDANLAVFGLLVAVTAPLGYLEAGWIHRERIYTSVTRDLIGDSEVKVHCQRMLANMVDVSGNMGYVPYPPGKKPVDAYLRNDTCKALDGYLSNQASPTLDQVRAVHVLTHEAMHLAGEKNEAHAECRAMQRNARTAELLGATPEQGQALATSYWEHWYPQVTSTYRDADCAPSGALDEGLPGAPWANR